MISQDPHPQVLPDLPPEVLTNIFLYLPNSSLLTCQRVNHYFRSLISNSVKIQYAFCSNLATQLNTDNPRCLLPLQERLELLYTKETKWEELTHNFRKIVNVPFPASGIYDLTGGIYLLGDETRRGLHYTYLPSMANDEVVWNHLRTDHKIIDMGLCVYEHDLIAVITTHAKISESTSASMPDRHEIQLQLHSVSTGLFHPEAERPTISVVITPWERPAVGVEIVGDNLVLILAYYEHPNKPDDQVFIYQWRTGKLKMRFPAPYHSYSGLLFLTADIVLLPNANAEQLEYWKIPPGDSLIESPRPFFALALPKLDTTKVYRHISCRADPNPTSTFRHSLKPFHADPQHTIAIFNLTIRSDNGVAGLLPHFNPIHSFIFFVHRSSLVQCLDKFSSAISHDRDLQPIPYSDWGQPICRWFAAEAFSTRWITTTAGQRCIIIPDIGYQIESAPLVLLNFNQNDIAKLLAIEKREYEARVRARLVKQRLIELRREGKEQTHQNLKQLIAAFRQTTVELNSSETNPDPGTTPLVADGVDDWVDTLSDDDSSDMDDSSKHRRRVKAMTRQNDALDDTQRCFQDIIYSNLPYTVCSSQEKYSFNGVLLDEERILGLGTNRLNRITTVDILHYG